MAKAVDAELVADAAFDFGSRQSRSGKDRFFAKRTQFCRANEGGPPWSRWGRVHRENGDGPGVRRKKKLANSLVPPSGRWNTTPASSRDFRHLEPYAFSRDFALVPVVGTML